MSPLMNYTTKVSTDRTIAEIQAKLAKAGATRIALEYADGEVEGLSFAIDTHYGRQAFTLPINWKSVETVLYRQGVMVEEDRARRVAWRILKDWLEAQLAFIETEMVTLDQVMLPYMRADGNRTVYELVVEQQLSLPSGSE